MRISVNLATRPFVELRPLFAQLRLAMIALALVAIGMGVAFVPPADQAVWIFELKMAAGCVGLLGLGAFFFVFNTRRAAAAAQIAEVPAPGDAR